MLLPGVGGILVFRSTSRIDNCSVLSSPLLCLTLSLTALNNNKHGREPFNAVKKNKLFFKE